MTCPLHDLAVTCLVQACPHTVHDSARRSQRDHERQRSGRKGHNQLERPLPIKGSAITYMLGDIMNIHVQNDNKHQAI